MKGAKLRVLNTLAYKLGAATIEHEKSGGGILSLFYKWWHIKKEHKKILRFQAMLDVARPELKRPPLYTYEDYNEALAAKAHLSYQIGLCVMEADRNKFSGGGGFLALKDKIAEAKRRHKKLQEFKADFKSAFLQIFKLEPKEFEKYYEKIEEWIFSTTFRELYKDSKYPPLLNPQTINYNEISPETAWQLNLPLPQNHAFTILGYGQSGHAATCGLLNKCGVVFSGGGWVYSAFAVYKANYNLLLREIEGTKAACYVNYGILQKDDEEKMLHLLDSNKPIFVILSDPISRFKNWINHNQWLKEAQMQFREVELGADFTPLIDRFRFGVEKQLEPYFGILKEKYAYCGNIYRYKTLLDMLPSASSVYYSDVSSIMPEVAFDTFTKLAKKFNFNVPKEEDRKYFDTLILNKYTWHLGGFPLVIKIDLGEESPLRVEIKIKNHLWQGVDKRLDISDELDYHSDMVGVYVDSEKYELLKQDSTIFKTFREYAKAFLDALEKETDRFAEISMTDKGIIDGFREDKTLWKHYKKMFDYEFSHLRAQNPEIMQGWKYFNEFENLFESECK